MGNLAKLQVKHKAEIAQEKADKRAKKERLSQAKQQYGYYTNYIPTDGYDSLERLVDNNKDNHLSTIVMFQKINQQLDELYFQQLAEETRWNAGHAATKDRLHNIMKQRTALTTELKTKCSKGGYKLKTQIDGQLRETNPNNLLALNNTGSCIGNWCPGDKKTDVCLAIGYLSHHTTENTCTDNNYTWIASEQKCLKIVDIKKREPVKREGIFK